MRQLINLVVAAIALTAPLGTMAQGHTMMGGGPQSATPDMDRGMQGMGSSRAMANMSVGEVRKVDSAVGKLTLRHGPLENLDMPGMTMVFRVKDPTWLAQVKVGDKVRFVAERVDGNLTVTTLQLEKK